MSKRGRGASRSDPDRVALDVGGEKFVSSISTLSASSAYFAALFARWDDDAADEHPEVFLDRDPDAFRVLLSCMRQKMALLPEGDAGLFRRSLLDAEFLGIDWLLQAVKVAVVDHMECNHKYLAVVRYNCSAHPLRIDDKTITMNSEQKVLLFDYEYRSICNAFDKEVLPSMFFQTEVERRRRARTMSIQQLIPGRHEDDSVVFFEGDDIQDRRRVLCYALLDGIDGSQRIEPVVRGRGIIKPADLAHDEWLTTDDQLQLVPASLYWGSEDDDDRHWAYEYEILREPLGPGIHISEQSIAEQAVL